MDRIINVKVGGNHLSKDNKNAGVKGEANVTKLRITFDEGWDGYAKTVTFFDALGGNPVKRLLTVDLIEDIVNDTRTYITSIPKEPLAIAGEMIFIIDGFYGEFVKNENGDYEIAYADKSKRQRSIADKLVVKDAPNTDTAGEPTDPTPTEPEQWQAQIEKIKDDIQQVAISKEETAEYAEDARGSVDAAAFYSNQAVESYHGAAIASNQAIAAAEKAETAIKHEPTIIDGYWHVWDATNKQYVDTGVKAQSGSTVHYGDNPPDDADVWIDPEGESAYNEIKNYIDEQTEILKSDVAGLQAQINEEAHFRGYVSTNAKIKALNATPNDFAYSAESGTKWVYDAEKGWIDTDSPVPDQLTPASDTTPLINGVASTGQENAYARGDHRHPTDTTRASVEDLNDLDQRVATNEKSISGAFGAIQGVENRVGDLEVAESNLQGRMISVEDKTAKLERDIEACGDFERIKLKDNLGNPLPEPYTLTEKVGQISLDLGNQYKELYIRLTMPMSDEAAAGTPKSDKARWRLYVLNDSGTSVNKMLYDLGNWFIQDYAEEWFTAIIIKVFGCDDKAYCRTELWHENTNGAEVGAYARPINTSTYSGTVSPTVPMARDYIDRIRFDFMTKGPITDGSVRYLPVGTKCEIWGVRK